MCDVWFSAGRNSLVTQRNEVTPSMFLQYSTPSPRQYGVPWMITVKQVSPRPGTSSACRTYAHPDTAETGSYRARSVFDGHEPGVLNSVHRSVSSAGARASTPTLSQYRCVAYAKVGPPWTGGVDRTGSASYDRRRPASSPGGEQDAPGTNVRYSPAAPPAQTSTTARPPSSHRIRMLKRIDRGDHDGVTRPQRIHRELSRARRWNFRAPASPVAAVRMRQLFDAYREHPTGTERVDLGCGALLVPLDVGQGFGAVPHRCGRSTMPPAPRSAAQRAAGCLRAEQATVRLLACVMTGRGDVVRTGLSIWREIPVSTADI